MTLAEDIAGFRHDPLGHVLYCYPWGQESTPLAGKDGPYPWHREMLTEIGDKLRAGELVNFADVLRFATSSGHGIGKSAMVAWIVRWALDTLVGTRVMVTANTEKQLTTKTWPELNKWHSMALTRDWWTWTATAYVSSDPEHAATWRADAITWSEHNTEAFAGAHNEGKRLVILFDEASAIGDPVWEVTEGALTDANTEILWAAFGNPTQATGRFRECFRGARHRWSVRQIDSRTVPGTNKTLLNQWVQDHGEDSDFVKVRVRGIFPAMSLKGLYSEQDVDAAFGRALRPAQYQFAPVILTCDPAWEGDDMLVIGKRQGLWFEILKEMPKNDNDIAVANILARYEDEYQADAVFIDLGYGTGIASAGKTMGRTWQLVSFAESPIDPGCLNKRAEMANLAKAWLKQGGALPGTGPGAHALRQQLLDIETVPRADGRLQLEAKKDMKARGLDSPGHFDALILSFAYPVQKKDRSESAATRPGYAEADYQPHGRFKRR